MRIVTLLISITMLLPAVLSGQHHYERIGERLDTVTIRPNELSVGIRSAVFFRNNEYDARYQKGYTLPGARVTAFAAYTLPAASGVRLSLGLSTLRYWGASRYPAGVAYADLPYWTDHGDYVRLRLLPHVQATLKPSPATELTLGTLVGGSAHELVEPIYNPELDLTADPEMGVQFRGDWQRFRMDAWVNWMSMIFKNDRHQEAFTFGVSTVTRLHSGERWRLELPVHAIATHRGGEYNWAQQDTVHTWMNAAGGLRLSYRPFSQKPTIFWGSVYALAALSSGGHFPYERGVGVYGSLGLELEHFSFRSDYWHGYQYVSPFASPFANALTFGMKPTANRSADYVRLYGGYSHRFGQAVALSAEAHVWFHPADSWTMSHALELTMRISPSFLIAVL